MERSFRHIIDVFFLHQRVADQRLIQMLGQRTKQQHTVNFGIDIDIPDDLEQHLLGYIHGQRAFCHSHPQSLRPFDGPALIAEVVGALAHPDDGQRGGDSPGLQGLYILHNTGVQAAIDLGALPYCCHRLDSLPFYQSAAAAVRSWPVPGRKFHRPWGSICPAWHWPWRSAPQQQPDFAWIWY